MTGLLALDLDGTTLRFDHSLAGADIAAATRARRAGIHVTIITGRLYTGANWVAETLGIDGLIGVMNGSEVVRVSDGGVVSRREINPELQAVIRRALETHGLTPFVYRPLAIHAVERDARYEQYLSTWTRSVNFHSSVSHLPWGSLDVLGICAVGEAEAIEAAAREVAVQPELTAEVFTTYSGETFMKVRRSGVDKGTALCQIAEHLGVPLQQTVVVGDWMNDLPMFRVAGRSFAMNGADPETVDAADAVLESVRGAGGGVAEVVDRVWAL